MTRNRSSSQSGASFSPQSWRCIGAAALLVVSVFLTMQMVSCAYYNTFYSARKYYRQALRAAQQPAKSPGAPAPTVSSTIIPPQVISLLDKSIEKCAKVISVYPKSKWVDDAIFLLGACYYQKREYDKSIQKFNELSMLYPKSPLIPEAQFLAGMCYFGKKDYDQSSPILEKVVKEYHDFKDRETALYTLGEVSLDRKKYAEALPFYKVVAGNKKSKLYFGSLSKIGECYFELAKYDSARTSFSAIVAGSRDEEQVLDGLIKIGDCYGAEKNFDAATKSYEESLTLAKKFGKTPVVRLKMADMASQKGDYKKAIEIYQSVVDESPRTIQASEAQFRIGYIYEVNLEDLEAASAAYDKVKQHASRAEFALMADMRSRGLAKLKEFNQAAKTSEGEKAAESAFLIAELSLFQLGKPDKAIEKYLSVERDFPTTSFAPKSAYAAAYVSLYMKQDTTSAVETLERIVKRFPRSEYASAAREILVSLGVEPPPEEAVEAAPQATPQEGKQGEKGPVQEAVKPSEQDTQEAKGALQEPGKPVEQEKPEAKGGVQELGKPPEGVRPSEETPAPGAPADTLRADTLKNETR